MRNLNLLIIASICLLMAFCTSQNEQTKDHETTQSAETQLGEISLNVTGSKEAMVQFEKGVLFLHSFEYEDARGAFTETLEIDSNFYMAYWGSAMTHNHPLWSRTNLEEARTIMNELAETKEERLNQAPTQYERDMFEGIELLFGEGDKIERDDAYALHMEQLHKKYPDDHEITSFYALSLLGSAEEGRDIEVYEKGASMAKKVLEVNPEHPGALHYLIHSYDDPEHAHQALFAAHKYSKIAPDAQHALHMPSHIFIALGDWENVVNSNIAAYAASKTNVTKHQLSNEKLGFHALHWLIYGHLQRGEIAEAEKLLEEMKSSTQGLTTPQVASYRTMIESTFRNETNRWKSEDVELESDISELSIVMQAINLTTKAKIEIEKNNINEAKQIITELENKRKEAQKLSLQRGTKMCNGVGWYNQLPTKADLNEAQIMEMELKAIVASIEKDDSKAEELLKKATKLQDETSFSFGPPTIAKPSHELYADWLLERGRKKEALVEYKKALEKAPGRKLALEGVEKCS